MGVVLDASAVLALLHDEPGAHVVESVLPDAMISSVNLAEVIGKLSAVGMPEETLRAAIGAFALEVVSFDEELGYRTGLLYRATQPYGLSLGDRACLALGLQRNLPVITADRTWSSLKLTIDIKVIR